MLRSCIAALVVVMFLLPFSPPAAAQDNPILRERLEQKIIEELTRHSTQETAWHNEKSVDRQKWTSGKILGRPIRVASWTEQSQSWIWLEDPQATTSLDLKQLVIRNGRVEFAAHATAQARFKVWGRIPKLVQASVGGTAHVYIEIAGSAAIGAGHLQDSKITVFDIRLENLQFNNDAIHPLEDLAKDALNDYADRKDEKLRKSLERAIDRVHF
jgi:hypothetical protein